MVSIVFSGLDLTDAADVARAVQVLRSLHQRAQLRTLPSQVQVAFDCDVALVEYTAIEPDRTVDRWLERFFLEAKGVFYARLVDAVRAHGRACVEEIAEAEGVTWDDGNRLALYASRAIVGQGEALPLVRRSDPRGPFFLYELV